MFARSLKLAEESHTTPRTLELRLGSEDTVSATRDAVPLAQSCCAGRNPLRLMRRRGRKREVRGVVGAAKRGRTHLIEPLHLVHEAPAAV